MCSNFLAGSLEARKALRISLAFKVLAHEGSRNTCCRSTEICLCAQVRDRATLHLAELDGKAGGLAAVHVQWNIPAKNLEKSLRAYLENGTDAPFDLVSSQPSRNIYML